MITKEYNYEGEYKNGFKHGFGVIVTKNKH